MATLTESSAVDQCSKKVGYRIIRHYMDMDMDMENAQVSDQFGIYFSVCCWQIALAIFLTNQMLDGLESRLQVVFPS